MKGLWSGIDGCIQADQARNEAGCLDWPGGDDLRRCADRHGRKADYLDGEP